VKIVITENQGKEKAFCMTTFTEYMNSLPRETSAQIAAIILGVRMMESDEEKYEFISKYSPFVLEKAVTAVSLYAKEQGQRNEEKA
jgi:hypothetical protein